MVYTLARSLWLLPALSSLFSFDKKESDSPPFAVSEIREGYDFIVIGAGTAGCVLANRLSEDPSVNVLLLEAGGQEPYESQIPAVAPYLQLTELDWRYSSETSSTYCLAMKDNKCNLPRGKILGGSSSINYMLYVRGNKKDFDHWEGLGNPGWNYESVLPYFKKSEDNQDPKIVGDGKYHSTGGYQAIKEAPWRTPLAETFIQAGLELNYPTVDVNAEHQTGFMIPQGYQYKGARSSTSKAFLQPISKRSNLDILLHATVTKVLLNKDNRVYGVIYERNNKSHTVKVSKEVILSAGAIGTVQILLLSSIGPEAHLRNLNMVPVVNLPVGRNLQDHVAAGVTFTIEQPFSIKRSRIESFKAGYQYSLFGTGPLTTFGCVEGIGFVNTKYINETIDWPDIEFHFLSGSQASDNGEFLRHTLNLREEYWHNYLASLADKDTFTIIAKLMRPQSRGFIELRSQNPSDKPKIVTNYFKEMIDMLTLIEGVKIAKATGESEAFKRLGSKIYNRPLPGCEHISMQLDKYWDCYLRHFTMTIYHYSGTAKMGPYWDPEAVVDPSLRVYGTSGLRVADASIFPTIPTGNTNAAVLMVAEKAADMIKDYWANAADRRKAADESAAILRSGAVGELPEGVKETKRSKRSHSPVAQVSLLEITKRSLELTDPQPNEEKLHSENESSPAVHGENDLKNVPLIDEVEEPSVVKDGNLEQQPLGSNFMELISKTLRLRNSNVFKDLRNHFGSLQNERDKSEEGESHAPQSRRDSNPAKELIAEGLRKILNRYIPKIAPSSDTAGTSSINITEISSLQNDSTDANTTQERNYTNDTHGEELVELVSPLQNGSTPQNVTDHLFINPRFKRTGNLEDEGGDFDNDTLFRDDL